MDAPRTRASVFVEMSKGKGYFAKKSAWLYIDSRVTWHTCRVKADTAPREATKFPLCTLTGPLRACTNRTQACDASRCVAVQSHA